MPIKPVVRYMLLCEDWRLDGPDRRRLSVLGLISNLHPLDVPPYPYLHRELCVFLALTDGHGKGEGKIVCDLPESGQRIFETPSRQIAFSADPLEVVGVSFRIRNCSFPSAGMYSVQFWFEKERIAECWLRLR